MSKRHPFPIDLYSALLFSVLLFTSISVQAQIDTSKILNEVEVQDKRDHHGMTRLKSVEGTAIYEGKKNEVILMKDVDANLASNNAREVFAKVPGINIWESDDAGVQIGIASRGLNPNRSAEFNMRQNGYDMSADALGYPEAYYMPPLEAIERVEIVRGAASLQYGSQFGGMINFVMKKGPKDKKFEFTNRNSANQFGLFSTFNSIGGTYKKWNYYGFYQLKAGQGWRPNTQFNVQAGYFNLQRQINTRWKVAFDVSTMHYLMQQPGGLTDAQFQQDPSASYRGRNWFKVDFNILALHLDYKINETQKVNLRTFATIGQRTSLGNLRFGTDLDSKVRDLISDHYANFGTEGRYLNFYKAFQKTHTFLAGFRLYNGTTLKQQGFGKAGKEADFSFNNPNNLEYYDYKFPSYNASLFVENIFNLHERFSITPGARIEYLQTLSDGYSSQIFRETALRDSTKYYEQKNLTRQVPLFGIGLCYVPYHGIELYGNISQNFKSLTFTDTKVENPNIEKVDPNLKDVTGYNADLGLRGLFKEILNFDFSLFFMNYDNRIGTFYPVNINGQAGRERTNIGTSSSLGAELFAEISIFRWAKLPQAWGDFSVYNSFSWVDAQYTQSNYKRLEGKIVEFAPLIMSRSGFTWKKGKFSTTWRYAYTSDQFTDAQNTLLDPLNASVGIVPAYAVADVSLKYQYKFLNIEGGVNNLTDQSYFTRRAASYPGPGIIPSMPRTFYVMVGFTLGGVTKK